MGFLTAVKQYYLSDLIIKLGFPSLKNTVSGKISSHPKIFSENDKRCSMSQVKL